MGFCNVSFRTLVLNELKLYTTIRLLDFHNVQCISIDFFHVVCDCNMYCMSTFVITKYGRTETILFLANLSLYLYLQFKYLSLTQIVFKVNQFHVQSPSCINHPPMADQ